MIGDIAQALGSLLIMLICMYVILFLSALFIRFIMHSLDTLKHVTIQSLSLWAVSMTLCIALLEVMGRFFLMSIDIQPQFATHIIGVLLLHVVYFIVAGLVTRALLAQHVQASVKENMLLSMCVGVCFYFVIGSLAGGFLHTIRAKTIAMEKNYAQWL